LFITFTNFGFIVEAFDFALVLLVFATQIDTCHVSVWLLRFFFQLFTGRQTHSY